MTEEGTVLVIEQPEGQKCAAIGGIMALRMSVRGVAGCVVGGRVRDIDELEKSGLPVSCSFPKFRSHDLASVRSRQPKKSRPQIIRDLFEPNLIAGSFLVLTADQTDYISLGILTHNICSRE
jgi:hypothetical protein